MYNLPICPICSCPSDWCVLILETNKKVFFCMECCEHFTEEDTKISKIKSSINENTIIDEVFLKFMNNIKNRKKNIKNETLEC